MAMITLRRSPYEYRRRVPHYQKSDRAVFATFRKNDREPLPPAARGLVLKHCLHDHGTRMLVHAVVVMPEHAHMLFTPLRDQRGWPIPVMKTLQLIKGMSAHSVNKLLGRKGPVWQDESFDHVLRSDESFEEKVQYIR
jgi:REP-associated tyrosine transposase